MRPPRSLFALALLAIIAVLAAACDSVRPFAIKVDGSEVSQSSVDDELEALADNEGITAQGGSVRGPDGTLSSTVTAYWLTLLVEQEVIDDEVERRGLEVSPADREEATEDIDAEFSAEVFEAFPDWLRDRMRGRYQRRAALVREIGGEAEGVTDAVLATAYDEFMAAQRSQCASGEFVAHILVETQAEADALAGQLALGGDFTTLARENSTDGSSVDGGELGCFDPAQLVPEFATAAEALAPGQVSPPVQTEFGFHVIKISDTIPLEAIAASLREQLEQQARTARNPELDALVAEAKVRVDPRYGEWKVRDGLGSVQPPAGATTSTSPPAPQPAPSP